jgi:hypothetical protein
MLFQKLKPKIYVKRLMIAFTQVKAALRSLQARALCFKALPLCVDSLMITWKHRLEQQAPNHDLVHF